MEAIILAGGKGSRLQTLVNDVPKPMADINGKPFLSYLLDYLLTQKISSVILSVCYKKEVIQGYFQDKYKNLKITYSTEDSPLGTGGAIAKALQKATQANIFILNGDTFAKVNLQQLQQQHVLSKSALTLALKPMLAFERYGQVITNQKKIIAFNEKKFVKKGKINAGVYLCQQHIFDHLSTITNFSFEDFLSNNIANIPMSGFDINDNYFIDIGIPKDYEQAQMDAKDWL